MYNTDWYAAFVETGKEDNVKERLEYRFQNRLRFYVPKRRLRERKDGQWYNALRFLFPGYVLINGQITVDDYYKFKNIPELWRLIANDSELLSIPEREISLISKLMDDGGIIGPSSLCEEGGQVRVVDGPLTGMEGQIMKIDRRKGRAKIKMAFLGEERFIELAVNLLAQV
jgi:transcriptional antiterminator NusG